jgi:hypothetical protein
VEATSIQRWIAIRALGVEKDPYTGLDRQTRTLVSTIIIQGEDEFSIIITADMDQGITYNLTIAGEATDVFNYELDMGYSWDFTTYIPPMTIVEIEDPDEDEDLLPDWMNDPRYFIIAAVIFVVLMILLILFAAIRRKRNLKKIWDANQNEAPRRRSRSEPPPPVVEEEQETTAEESEPATMSYDDLYGTSMESNEPAYSEPEETPEPEGVEWDEDDDPEDWDDDENEEWEEDDDKEGEW